MTRMRRDELDELEESVEAWENAVPDEGEEVAECTSNLTPSGGTVLEKYLESHARLDLKLRVFFNHDASRRNYVAMFQCVGDRERRLDDLKSSFDRNDLNRQTGSALLNAVPDLVFVGVREFREHPEWVGCGVPTVARLEVVKDRDGPGVDASCLGDEARSWIIVGFDATADRERRVFAVTASGAMQIADQVVEGAVDLSTDTPAGDLPLDWWWRWKIGDPPNVSEIAVLLYARLNTIGALLKGSVDVRFESVQFSFSELKFEPATITGMHMLYSEYGQDESPNAEDPEGSGNPHPQTQRLHARSEEGRQALN